MATITLKLNKNNQLSIDYQSDGDALAFEHEEDHKAVLKQLLIDNQDIEISRHNQTTKVNQELVKETIKEKLKL